MQSASSGKSSSPPAGSSRSRRLNILSLAAIPFIAMWKYEPSLLIGRKNSAASRIIVSAPESVILFLEYSDSDTMIPAAAPPYAMMSMTLVELSCIVRTFIVTFLKCSDSKSILLAAY